MIPMSKAALLERFVPHLGCLTPCWWIFRVINCHPLTTNPLLSLFIWVKEPHNGVEDQRRFLQIKGSCSVLRML